MRELILGHRYALSNLDGPGTQIIDFVSRPPFNEPREGTTNQEVARVLIARVKALNDETPWEGNELILYHLRMMIALHECRALLRHVERREIRPEELAVGADGHFIFQQKD